MTLFEILLSLVPFVVLTALLITLSYGYDWIETYQRRRRRNAYLRQLDREGYRHPDGGFHFDCNNFPIHPKD